MLKKNRGFTLIELLVALAVFAVVIVLAVDIFLRGLEGQRKSSALQLVQENGRYALELMAREIRMSTINTSERQSNILEITAYKSSGSEDVSYELSGGQILRNSQAITSEKVKVSSLNFYIRKNNIQPNVTITMTIETFGEKASQKSKINLETTISSRDYSAYDPTIPSPYPNP